MEELQNNHSQEFFPSNLATSLHLAHYAEHFPLALLHLPARNETERKSRQDCLSPADQIPPARRGPAVLATGCVFTAEQCFLFVIPSTVGLEKRRAWV